MVTILHVVLSNYLYLLLYQLVLDELKEWTSSLDSDWASL